MVSEKVRELEKENAMLRERVAQLRSICGGNEEVPKNCEYCSNFCQYYIENGGNYYPAYIGQCKAGHRVKKKMVKETCSAFAQKTYGKNFI